MSNSPNPKDRLVSRNRVTDLSVEYVPVPAGNQVQPQTANMIVASLGGSYEEVPDGDEVQRGEGWVPPGNRNGSTGLSDPSLGRDKLARLNLIDQETELGNFPRTVDPRDNANAPDERVASEK